MTVCEISDVEMNHTTTAFKVAVDIFSVVFRGQKYNSEY